MFVAKTAIARSALLAPRLARLRHHGSVLGSGTEVVIEGFPRSGTSFAVAAFRRAQGRSVEVACHVHAPAQIVEGVRRSLPVMLIVRDPEATTVSFAIRNPELTLRQALRAYLRFHEPLVALRDRVVVGRFDEVTVDLGAVIDRVNQRFGTSFARFEQTPEAVASVFAEIDEDYAKRLSGESFERAVARPSERRDALKPQLEAAYRAADLASLRSRAERAFARLTADA